MRLRHLSIVAAAVTGATGTAMTAAQFAEGHGRFLAALVSRPYSTAGGAIGGALCGVLAWVLLRHRDNAIGTSEFNESVVRTEVANTPEAVAAEGAVELITTPAPHHEPVVGNLFVSVLP